MNLLDKLFVHDSLGVGTVPIYYIDRDLPFAYLNEEYNIVINQNQEYYGRRIVDTFDWINEINKIENNLLEFFVSHGLQNNVRDIFSHYKRINLDISKILYNGREPVAFNLLGRNSSTLKVNIPEDILIFLPDKEFLGVMPARNDENRGLLMHNLRSIVAIKRKV